MAAEHNTPESHDNKVKSSVSLSHYLIEWMDEEIRKKKFSSRSGMIEIALGEMKGRREEREEFKKEDVCTDDDDLPKLMLKFLSRHQELIDEVNELKGQSRDRTGYNKRVKFE